jgi:hypothetical protein
MKIGQSFCTIANLPERIRMITTSTLNAPLQAGVVQDSNFLNLNDYLLPANPDDALLVKIDEDSEDFRAGDLLVLDISKQPETSEFVLIQDGETRSIDKYSGSGDVFGVVTSVIRKL